jgi:hypothetical protein
MHAPHIHSTHALRDHFSAQPSDQDLGANNGLAGGKGDVLVQDGDDLPITPSTGTSTVAGNVGASAGFTASMVPAAVVCVGSLLAMLFS